MKDGIHYVPELRVGDDRTGSATWVMIEGGKQIGKLTIGVAITVDGKVKIHAEPRGEFDPFQVRRIVHEVMTKLGATMTAESMTPNPDPEGRRN